jgi:hypothetical protein
MSLHLAALGLSWPWPCCCAGAGGRAGRAWLKALLVVGVTVLYFWGADDVVHGVWGWPSPHALPERFVLLAAVIEEPTQEPGALYVWVNAIENGKPAPQPRAYRCPTPRTCTRCSTKA